jgi:hypothetical protein
MLSTPRSSWSRCCSLASLPLAGVVLAMASPAGAVTPSDEMVMLDIDKLDTVTNAVEPDNYRLSWRELIDAGISGLQIRHWTGAHDNSYTYTDLVADAHSYGLWVCGGTGVNDNSTVNDAINMAADLATAGVDFIQLDEPMGYGLTEADYHAIRDSAQAVNPSCPVLITDVFYNETVATFWPADGLIQEVYVDEWYPWALDMADWYQDGLPSLDVMMWVWLINRHPVPEPCEVYPDSKFDLWFNESFNRFGKVLLFIFQSRTIADPCDGWTSNWAARVPTIQAATNGLRVSLPEWSGFLPDSPAQTGTPDCSVQVRSEGAGLDPGTVQALYSTDAGGNWTEWHDVQCTGSVGTTGWETITALDVPFQQISSTDNRIRFKIRDTYSGTYYRNARTDQMDFTVDITSLGGGDDDDAGDDDGGDDDGGDDDAGDDDDDGSDDDDAGDGPDFETPGCECAQSSTGGHGARLLLAPLALWCALRRRS